jgi:glutamate synthase (NADPH/NADH) large chain
MMRVCHLDTCPVGIATQNPDLRARFTGRPEFVVNFFEFIAEEVRELMAQLGFRSVDEMVGHVEVLDVQPAVDHWKASNLDISPILAVGENRYDQSLHCTTGQDHGLESALDVRLIELAQNAIDTGTPVRFEVPVRNVNRTVGTLLGHEITRRHRGAGLADDTITIDFTGSAGQSFGAFVPSGVTMRLHGDANDYVGKGLSGGRLIIAPPPGSPFVAEEQVIAGNVIGYGATGGEMFIRGVVGERFCVRNSGAVAVVEAIGDHGCEYMTGGVVVVLGETGRNFGAGMSGGVAYVYDRSGDFDRRVNSEMVDIETLTDEDRQYLRELVERHSQETGSAVAARLLASWSVEISRFRKVMPSDYRRVLEVMNLAASQGLDEAETMKRVMEAAHG